MSPTPTLFRVLLAVSLVAGIAGALFDLVYPGFIPKQLSELQDSLAETESSIYEAIALGLGAILLLIGGLSAFVGLWLFRRWSPRLALMVTFLAFAILPVMGFQLTSGIAASLNEISVTLWGGVLAMAYFSALRTRFFGEGK